MSELIDLTKEEDTNSCILINTEDKMNQSSSFLTLFLTERNVKRTIKFLNLKEKIDQRLTNFILNYFAEKDVNNITGNISCK